ncbi:hypothetical protein D3C84_884190 [compost metagenome]
MPSKTIITPKASASISPKTRADQRRTVLVVNASNASADTPKTHRINNESHSGGLPFSRVYLQTVANEPAKTIHSHVFTFRK